jgi:hypothetical protein
MINLDLTNARKNMSATSSVEKTLDGVFKSAPKLSENVKEAIAKWVPWINLFLGIVGLWTAYTLWHWAHVANGLVDYVNNLSASYGGSQVVADRMNVGIWAGIVILAIESILYLMAFGPTKDRRRRGWDLMFYAILLNAVYGFALLFTNYGAGASSLIGYLIGTTIGLYFLFQLKSKYTK